MANEKSVIAVIRAARPTFRNNFDKIAFVVHASFLSSGYVLTATGPQALFENALSNSSTEEISVDHWNELNDEYAFVYANPEKGSKKVLVKCLVMNDKLLVDALSEGSSEPVHLELNVGEFTGENVSNNYSDHFKNLEKLMKKLDVDILSKLDASSQPSSSSNPRSSEAGERSRHETPIIVEPSRPQPFHRGIVYPPVNPIGGSDLLPGAGAGMYPTRVDHGFGGSMLIGPDDPRWFGVGGDPAFPGGQPGVPPGARFDPYGPPRIPGFEPNRFARNPRRPGQDTHPDLQHFRSDTDSDFI